MNYFQLQFFILIFIAWYTPKLIYYRKLPNTDKFIFLLLLLFILLFFLLLNLLIYFCEVTLRC